MLLQARPRLVEPQTGLQRAVQRQIHTVCCDPEETCHTRFRNIASYPQLLGELPRLISIISNGPIARGLCSAGRPPERHVFSNEVIVVPVRQCVHVPGYIDTEN